MNMISFLKQIDCLFFNSFFRPDFRIEVQKIQRQGMNGLYLFMANLPIIFVIVMIEKFMAHNFIFLELMPIVLSFTSFIYLY